MMFRGSINRTQKTGGGDLFVANCKILVGLTSSPIFTSLRGAQERTAPGVPTGPNLSCLLVLTWLRPGCFC